MRHLKTANRDRKIQAKGRLHLYNYFWHCQHDNCNIQDPYFDYQVYIWLFTCKNLMLERNV